MNHLPRLAHAGLSDLAKLEAEFAAAGFVEGKPPAVSPDTIAIDEEVLREGVCDCGHTGQALIPYRHRTCSSAYRAIGLCPRCLAAIEI